MMVLPTWHQLSFRLTYVVQCHNNLGSVQEPYVTIRWAETLLSEKTGFFTAFYAVA